MRNGQIKKNVNEESILGHFECFYPKMVGLGGKFVGLRSLGPS